MMTRLTQVLKSRRNQYSVKRVTFLLSSLVFIYKAATLSERLVSVDSKATVYLMGMLAVFSLLLGGVITIENIKDNFMKIKKRIRLCVKEIAKKLKRIISYKTAI
jgi:hypothetical protein